MEKLKVKKGDRVLLHATGWFATEDVDIVCDVSRITLTGKIRLKQYPDVHFDKYGRLIEDPNFLWTDIHIKPISETEEQEIQTRTKSGSRGDCQCDQENEKEFKSKEEFLKSCTRQELEDIVIDQDAAEGDLRDRLFLISGCGDFGHPDGTAEYCVICSIYRPDQCKRCHDFERMKKLAEKGEKLNG